MSFPKADLPKRGEGSSWPRLEIGLGESREVFSAGPVVWAICHFAGAHKVCAEWMSGGELPCRFDHTKFKFDKVGYWPVYDDNHKPLFVVLREYHEQRADELRLHFRYKLSMSKGEERSLGIKQVSNKREFYTSVRWQMAEQHIEPWLLRLWKDAELTAWVEGGGLERMAAAGDNAVSFSLRAPGEPGDQSAMLDKHAARVKATADDGYDAAREKMAKLKNRLPKPSTNGSHA